MPNIFTATIEIKLPDDERAEAQAKLDIWPLWDQFRDALTSKGFEIDGEPLHTKTPSQPQAKRPPTVTSTGKRMGRPPKAASTTPASTTPINGATPPATATTPPGPTLAD